MSSPEILHMSFNRDGTALSVGTLESCFHLSVDTPEKPERLEYGSNLGARIVTRLGRSSLVALVFVHTPRKLRILNMSKNEEICSHLYKDSVLEVRITAMKMVVCLQHRIYIHSTKNMQVEHVLGTNSNPRGVISLSQEGERLLLAYPAAEGKGEIQIFDAVAKTTGRLIQAFKDQPLAYLQFNDSGSLLAAASVEGTHIVVVSPLDGHCLYNFYRGFTSVEVYNINFSKDDKFLAVTTSNPTVHIFKLDVSGTGGDDKNPNTNWGVTGTAGNGTVTVNECGYSGSQIAVSSTSSSSGEDVFVSTNNAEGTTTATATETDYSSYYSINSWIGWAKSTIVPILPTNISESLTGSNRAFATIRMPYKDVKSIVAVTTSYTEDGPEGRVIIGAYDGFIYIYKLKRDVGGECELLKQIEAVGN